MEHADKFTSIEDFGLGVIPVDAVTALNKLFDEQTQTCAEFIKSGMIADLCGLFVNPSDMSKDVGGATMDVPTLIVEVAKILPDMLMPLSWETKNRSLDVMKKILFKIGPETRSIKKGTNPDGHWRIRICSDTKQDDLAKIGDADILGIQGTTLKGADLAKANKELTKTVVDYVTAAKYGDKYLISGMLVISTYKSTTAPMTAPKILKGNVVSLTVKQASIVGLYILEKLTRLAYTKDYTIFTPLAGAIYSRDNVAGMMEDPVIKAAFKTAPNLIDCINKSAQNGGQFLQDSRSDVAAACVMVGTSAVKKVEERKSIVQRTVRQFRTQKRPGDRDVFAAMCKFATGGVDVDWTFEALVAEYDQIKMTQAALMRAAAQARVGLEKNE